MIHSKNKVDITWESGAAGSVGKDATDSPDDLSLIPRTYVVEGKSQFLQAFPLSPE